MAATDEALRTAGTARADERPEPVDYAAINAVYAALAAGLLYATPGRGGGAPTRGGGLVPRWGAPFALSKVTAREKVGPGGREPFVDQDGHPPRPAGRRLQRAVG